MNEPQTQSSDWEINCFDDLKKIADISTPKEALAAIDDSIERDEFDTRQRLARLTEMGFVAGDAVTPLGKQFVEHCLQHYTEFSNHNGKYHSLAFSTDPESYPEIGQRGDSQWYWDQLGEANDSLRRQLFDCESMLVDHPLLKDAVDIDRRFGDFNTRNSPPTWSPRWDCYGGNGWGANDQHLVSDYLVEHFEPLLEDLDEHGWCPDYGDAFEGVETQAQALASCYEELWALYLWSLHFQAMTSPQELVYQWRWNLAQCAFEIQFEELVRELSLRELFERIGNIDTMSAWTVLRDVVEFGADSDSNLELLHGVLPRLQNLRNQIYEATAQGMRDEGATVICVRDGDPCPDYLYVTENGAKQDPTPVQRAVREVMRGGSRLTNAGPLRERVDALAGRVIASTKVSDPATALGVVFPEPEEPSTSEPSED